MFELNLARKHHAGEIAALSRDHIETGLGWSWTAERVAVNIDAPEDVVLAGTHIDRLAGFAIMRMSCWQVPTSIVWPDLPSCISE